MLIKQGGKHAGLYIAVFFLGIALAFFQTADAYGREAQQQGPGVHGPHGGSHAQPITRGRVLDTRHGHNHRYPVHGHYVRTVPAGHRVVVHGGVNYYYHGGVWYRPWGPRFVVVGPPVGIVVPFLPPFYATVWVGAVPYYYANSVYYVSAPGGYAVVDPPQQGQVAGAPPPPADQAYVYPRQGQNERQQSDDKYACHKWAAGQTGFDPTQPPAGLGDSEIMQRRADYQRAMAACLEGRGYTVK
ncbi:MAG: DUF6515 family protein [Syntrophaceae bacterium]